MAKENIAPRWKGKGIAELKSLTAAQVWPLIEDFCSLHKLIPALKTCRAVEGVNGKPGLTRYCVVIDTQKSSSALPPKAAKMGTKWCHEKLLFIDPVQRRLSYEMTENTLGFGFYVAEWNVMDMDGGCRIEVSFTADPIEGWKLEDLCGFIESTLKVIVGAMEKELRAATV